MNIIWCSALIVFIIAEFATAGLVTVWFAFGALAALISTLFGTPEWLQTVIFVAVSVACLIITRPLAKKYINSGAIPTNADRSIGREAIVTVRIDNLSGTGTVNLEGVTWSSASLNGDVIDEGAHVFVREIRGVKLIVEKAVSEPQK